MQPLDAYEFKVVKGGVNGWFKVPNTLTPDGKSLFGPMPWLSGKYLQGGYSAGIRPNLSFFPRLDVVQYMVTYPEGVNKCKVIWANCFPKSFFDLPDFDAKAKVYEDFTVTFLTEDVDMVRAVHQAYKSRVFRPGRKSEYEFELHNWQSNYLGRLFNP